LPFLIPCREYAVELAQPHPQGQQALHKAPVQFRSGSWLPAATQAGEEQVATQVAMLKDKMAARPRLKPLTSNPLLLTFLVILAGQNPEEDLPGILRKRAGNAAPLRNSLFTPCKSY
jgi:hypothetical protein